MCDHSCTATSYNRAVGVDGLTWMTPWYQSAVPHHEPPVPPTAQRATPSRYAGMRAIAALSADHPVGPGTNVGAGDSTRCTERRGACTRTTTGVAPGPVRASPTTPTGVDACVVKSDAAAGDGAGGCEPSSIGTDNASPRPAAT